MVPCRVTAIVNTSHQFGIKLQVSNTSVREDHPLLTAAIFGQIILLHHYQNV